MSKVIKVKTFSKKEAQQIIKIFKKDLLKKELLESEKELVLDFKKYLKKINLECIITSREKIIYSFGERIESYLNNNISNYLSDCINDKSLASMKGSYLEIINKKNIRGIYIYKPLTFKNFNIGSLIFISKNKLTEKQLDLLVIF